MEFEEACSEIDYILEHMDPNDINLIPANVREFFSKNKSVFYKVNLDVTKELKQQPLKDETKAFIKILNEKYLYKHNEQNINNLRINNKREEQVQIRTNEIIVYKENKFRKWIKRVFSFFKRK